MITIIPLVLNYFQRAGEEFFDAKEFQNLKLTGGVGVLKHIRCHPLQLDL